MRRRVRLYALAALCLCAYVTEGRVPRAMTNPPREVAEAVAKNSFAPWKANERVA